MTLDCFVPPGRNRAPVYSFDSTSHQRKTFEDDDQYEDDVAYANISSNNARIVAHERAAACAL